MDDPVAMIMVVIASLIVCIVCTIGIHVLEKKK